MTVAGCDTLDPGNNSPQPWSQDRNSGQGMDSYSQNPADRFR